MTDLYKVNLSSVLIMSAVLVFLLISCLLQRRHLMMARPLFFLIAVTLLLLLCQAAEWLLMILSGDQKGLAEPAFRNWKILAYTLDFFFSYFSSVCFYHYIREHIRDLYAQAGPSQSPAPPLIPMKILFYLGLAATAFYGFCMTQSWFFYLKPNGAEMLRPRTYIALYILVNIVSVFTCITLIRHRKILGRLNLWLLLFYEISPTALLIPDLISGTCLTYLMRAFYTFILYVHVDLRSEQQTAERMAQLARQEKELTDLRTQIMLSQIQPHFLYNTLTTIGALCSMERSREAEDVVNKFAVYFRQNMESLSRERYIPFERELEHVRTYLWIEKVRFEDSLNVDYKIGPTNFHLPSLSLQPLVENAVKHGICKKETSGTVTIGTKETADEFLVIISDDGVGFDPMEKLDERRAHVGIENTRTRLEILCHGRLEIQSRKGEGTTATIHLPKEGQTLCI